MTHVISVSSGLSSALVAERVQRKHGKVALVFMDTTIEDDDNYRFLNQMAAELQVQIVDKSIDRWEVG